MIPAWLSLLDSLFAIALVAAGILAAHLEVITAMMGFQAFLLGFLLALLGFLAGLIALWRTANPARRAGRARAITGTLLGLLVAGPIIVIIACNIKAPPINDITTDFDHPPEFVHAVSLPANEHRDLRYDRAKFAASQTAAYGALEPLKVAEAPTVAFEQVKVVAAEVSNWSVTFADPKRLALEGVAASPLFRFNDDFVIQVRPAKDGSVIEMRSKSRDGLSDLGANVRRIRAFFAMFARNQGAAPPAHSDGTAPAAPG